VEGPHQTLAFVGVTVPEGKDVSGWSAGSGYREQSAELQLPGRPKVLARTFEGVGVCLRAIGVRDVRIPATDGELSGQGADDQLLYLLWDSEGKRISLTFGQAQGE
jgi:hypothetical protein